MPAAPSMSGVEPEALPHESARIAAALVWLGCLALGAAAAVQGAWWISFLQYNDLREIADLRLVFALRAIAWVVALPILAVGAFFALRRRRVGVWIVAVTALVLSPVEAAFTFHQEARAFEPAWQADILLQVEFALGLFLRSVLPGIYGLALLVLPVRTCLAPPGHAARGFTVEPS